MSYQAKYLKTREEIVIKDCFTVSINEFDLVNLIECKDEQYRFELMLNRLDLDDDTKAIIKDLVDNYWFSLRVIKLIKKQQHLRELGRVETAWLTINKRECNNVFGRPVGSKNKKIESKEENDRLEYLRANFDSIANKCVKHDWFDEYLQLYKDVFPNMSRKEIIEKYKVEKNNARVL